MVIGVRFMRAVSIDLAESRLRPGMGQRFQQTTPVAFSTPRPARPGQKSAVFARYCKRCSCC
jgi:hypothetical protein